MKFLNWSAMLVLAGSGGLAESRLRWKRGNLTGPARRATHRRASAPEAPSRQPIRMRRTRAGRWRQRCTEVHLRILDDAVTVTVTDISTRRRCSPSSRRRAPSPADSGGFPMRTIRPILLASAAAVLAAACSRDATAPGGPTIAGAPEAEPSRSPFFLGATTPDTTTTDSVIGGIRLQSHGRAGLPVLRVRAVHGHRVRRLPRHHRDEQGPGAHPDGPHAGTDSSAGPQDRRLTVPGGSIREERASRGDAEPRRDTRICLRGSASLREAVRSSRWRCGGRRTGRCPCR